MARHSSLTGSCFIPSHGEKKEGRSADIATDVVGIVSSSHHEGNDDVSLSPDNAQSIAISDNHGPNMARPNMAQGPNTSLVNILSWSNVGLDLLDELQGRYHQDPVFQAILQRPSDFWNFKVMDQLIYLRESEQKVLCIPKVLIQGWSTQEIVISEAHSLLTHLGAAKTLDYLQDHVWWKDMVANTKLYCKTCHTCKLSKPSNQKPYGFLNPLSLLSYP